jgi:hypothetical protein
MGRHTAGGSGHCRLVSSYTSCLIRLDLTHAVAQKYGKYDTRVASADSADMPPIAQGIRTFHDVLNSFRQAAQVTVTNR